MTRLVFIIGLFTGMRGQALAGLINYCKQLGNSNKWYWKDGKLSVLPCPWFLTKERAKQMLGV